MRWPWQRRVTPPVEPQRPRVVPPRRDWAGLTPLQRTLGAPALTSNSARFAATLASRSARPLVQPLTHGVMRDAPAGQLLGVARPGAASLPVVDRSQHDDLPLVGEAVPAQRTVWQRRPPLTSAPQAATPALTSAPPPDTPGRRVRVVPGTVQRRVEGEAPPSPDVAGGDASGADVPGADDAAGATPVAEGGSVTPDAVSPPPAAPTDEAVEADAPTLAAGGRERVGGERGSGRLPLQQAAAPPDTSAPSASADRVTAQDPDPLPVARMTPGDEPAGPAEPGSTGSQRPGLGPGVPRGVSGGPVSSSPARPSGAAAIQRAADGGRAARRRIGLGEPFVRPAQRDAAPGADARTSAPDSSAGGAPSGGPASARSSEAAPSGAEGHVSDPSDPSDPGEAQAEPGSAADMSVGASSVPLIGERPSPVALGGDERASSGGEPHGGAPAVSSGAPEDDLPLQRSAGAQPGAQGDDAAPGAPEAAPSGAEVHASDPGAAGAEPGSAADGSVGASSVPLIGERPSPVALGGATGTAPASVNTDERASSGAAPSVVPSGAPDGDLPLQRSTDAQAGSAPGGELDMSPVADDTPQGAPEGAPRRGSGSAPTPSELLTGAAVDPQPVPTRRLASAPLLGHRPPLLQRTPAASPDPTAGSPAAASRAAGPADQRRVGQPAPMSATAPTPRPARMQAAVRATQRVAVQPLRRVAPPGAIRGAGTPPNTAAPRDVVTPASAHGTPPTATGADDVVTLRAPDATALEDTPTQQSHTVQALTALAARPAADASAPAGPRTTGATAPAGRGAPPYPAAGAARQPIQRAQPLARRSPMGPAGPTAALAGSDGGVHPTAARGSSTNEMPRHGVADEPSAQAMSLPVARLEDTTRAGPVATSAAGSVAASAAGQAMDLPVARLAEPEAAQASPPAAFPNPRGAPLAATPAPLAATPAPPSAAPAPPVQRQEAPAAAAQPPTATATAGSAAAGSATAAAGATAQSEEELDVLAGRLYDHIAGRLRRELRMDRERTGLLTDLS